MDRRTAVTKREIPLPKLDTGSPLGETTLKVSNPLAALENDFDAFIDVWNNRADILQRQMEDRLLDIVRSKSGKLGKTGSGEWRTPANAVATAAKEVTILRDKLNKLLVMTARLHHELAGVDDCMSLDPDA